MTYKEAQMERRKIESVIKNWRAKDDWHEAMRNRYDDLFDFMICYNGKDPGPWEMPPIPEGVEP